MNRGAFIVFEGIDRSGKSTQSKKLVEYLTSRGVRVQKMNFPERNSVTGAKINEYLCNKTEMGDKEIHKLFAANRLEMKDHIENALKSGEYAFSGVAYSLAKEIEGMNLKWCKDADEGLPAPDLVFFLDIDPEKSKSRSEYGQERYEKLEFQKRVQKAFKLLVEENWKVLEGTQSVDELHLQITEIANQVLQDVKAKPLQHLWNKK